MIDWTKLLESLEMLTLEETNHCLACQNTIRIEMFGDYQGWVTCIRCGHTMYADCINRTIRDLNKAEVKEIESNPEHRETLLEHQKEWQEKLWG